MRHVHLGISTWVIFFLMFVVSLAALHLLTDWIEANNPDSVGASAGHWLLGEH